MVSQHIETKKLIFFQNIRQDKRIQANQTEALVRQTLEDFMDYTAIATTIEYEISANYFNRQKQALREEITKQQEAAPDKFTQQMLNQLLASIEEKKTTPKNNILFEDFASMAYNVGIRPDNRSLLGKIFSNYNPLQAEIHRREEGLQALQQESKIHYYTFPKKEKKIIQNAIKQHQNNKEPENLQELTGLASEYALRSKTLLSLSSMRIPVAKELYYNENNQREIHGKEPLFLSQVNFLSKMLHHKAYSNHIQKKQLDYILSRVAPQISTKTNAPAGSQQKTYVMFLKTQ